MINSCYEWMCSGIYASIYVRVATYCKQCHTQGMQSGMVLCGDHKVVIGEMKKGISKKERREGGRERGREGKTR